EAIADRLGLVEVEFGPVPGERTTRTGEGRLVERRHDRAAKAPVRACDGNPHSAELGRGFRSLFGRGLLGRGAAGDSGFVLARVVGVPLAGLDGAPPALVGAEPVDGFRDALLERNPVVPAEGAELRTVHRVATIVARPILDA